jgi:hypothetical protein
VRCALFTDTVNMVETDDTIGSDTIWTRAMRVSGSSLDIFLPLKRAPFYRSRVP